MANISTVEKIFLELVKIPSPSGKEDKVREYILSRVKAYAKNIFVDSVGNLFFQVGKGQAPLLLCAHMDTVLPTGKQEPKIVGGRIISNGKYVLGADNKAAIAAILAFFEKATKQEFEFCVEVLFTVREETEGGIRRFPKSKIVAQNALLLDSSAPIGKAIIASPFVGGYAVYVRTKGCHVKEMKRKTVHPLNFFKDFLESFPFGKIGKDTIINIAKIRMGKSYNSVPEELYFTGEIRTFDGKTYKDFFSKLENEVRRLDKKIGTKSKIELYPYCKGYSLRKKDLTGVKRVFDKLGLDLEFKKDFGVGDWSILGEWGIKAINLSNGVIGAHTTSERIAIRDLVLLERIIEEYVREFAQK